MPQLYGEYPCKLDAKGRLKMPAALLKKLGGDGPWTFFVNRGLENCLMIYPEEVWESTVEQIRTLNPYRAEDRNFTRMFFRGAHDIVTDSADRILINKGMLEHAGIEKDAILFAYLDRMELWNRDRYFEILDADAQDYSELAEKVLGGSQQSADI